MTIDIKLIKEDSVAGKRRISVHYVYFEGCRCKSARRQFYVYTEDKDFDVIDYIKTTYHENEKEFNIIYSK